MGTAQATEQVEELRASLQVAQAEAQAIKASASHAGANAENTGTVMDMVALMLSSWAEGSAAVMQAHTNHATGSATAAGSGADPTAHGLPAVLTPRAVGLQQLRRCLADGCRRLLGAHTMRMYVTRRRQRRRQMWLTSLVCWVCACSGRVCCAGTWRTRQAKSSSRPYTCHRVTTTTETGLLRMSCVSRWVSATSAKPPRPAASSTPLKPCAKATAHRYAACRCHCCCYFVLMPRAVFVSCVVLCCVVLRRVALRCVALCCVAAGEACVLQPSP